MDPLTGGLPFSSVPQQMTEQQKQQALKIWAERQKAEKERGKQLKALQDAVSKMDAEREKHRKKTAIEVNKNMQKVPMGQ